jgi:hypothetical protein
LPPPIVAEAEVALYTITMPKATSASVTRTRTFDSSCPRFTSQAAFGSRPAEPGSAEGWRRWRQDAAPAALVRTGLYCPARRRLASFASAAPET